MFHQLPGEHYETVLAFKVPGSNANHPKTGEPFYELAWEPDQNDAGDEVEWTKDDTKRLEDFRSTQVRDRIWNNLIRTYPATAHDPAALTLEGDEDDGESKRMEAWLKASVDLHDVCSDMVVSAIEGASYVAMARRAARHLRKIDANLRKLGYTLDQLL